VCFEHRNVSVVLVLAAARRINQDRDITCK